MAKDYSTKLGSWLFFCFIFPPIVYGCVALIVQYTYPDEQYAGPITFSIGLIAATLVLSKELSNNFKKKNKSSNKEIQALAETTLSSLVVTTLIMSTVSKTNSEIKVLTLYLLAIIASWCCMLIGAIKISNIDEKTNKSITMELFNKRRNKRRK